MSGVAIIGDVHGRFVELGRLAAALPPGLPVVQMGDLAAYPPHFCDPARRWTPLARPLHFVRGNHDYLPAIRGLTEPAEVLPGLVYLPAGVHALGGLRVGVLGGAESVDGPARTAGVDWWPDEEGTTVEEFDRLLDAARVERGVDLLVTHTPPASTVSAMLAQAQRSASVGDAAAETTPAHDTPSAVRVEQAWRVLGQPPLVCGHMHRPWRDGVVEVLGFLGVTLRALHHGRVRRPGSLR